MMMTPTEPHEERRYCVWRRRRPPYTRLNPWKWYLTLPTREHAEGAAQRLEARRSDDQAISWEALILPFGEKPPRGKAAR